MAAIIFAKKILSWLGFEKNFYKTGLAPPTPILLETIGKGGIENTSIIVHPAEHNLKQYGNDLAKCRHFTSGGSSGRFPIYINVARSEKNCWLVERQ